jgi:glutaminyl-peptide cyclotransferase
MKNIILEFSAILHKRNPIFIINILAVLLLFLGCSSDQFEKSNIIDHIEKQLSFGPRLPGSYASQLAANYFRENLESNGWKVEFQEFEFGGKTLRNVIAKNSSNPPKLIIGTHYDTRQFSDQDSEKIEQTFPVPGAIDGASGSALILELSEHIFKMDKSIWLLFFDGEDQGKINGWEWSIGADYFVSELDKTPDQVVILDMLGDDDLQVFKEKNSDPALSNEIWTAAKKIGFGNYFKDKQKYALIDDHLPFVNQGIPASLLIDFDYPYWHTTSDTLDKVSIRNLEIVFEVMLEWIKSI